MGFLFLNPMALAQTSYPSAGVGPYTIPFPYLVRAHIEVLVNGALQTQGVAYTFPTASSIQFTAPPAAGTIVIRRNSSQSTRLTNYQDGSKLGEQQLDFDVNQAFYVAQEALDAAELAQVGGAPVSAANISVTAGNGMSSFNVQGALDEHQADINGINATLATRAPLASPVFTGTPQAPTAPLGTGDTRLATAEFVQNELAADTGSLAEHQSPNGVAKFPTLDRMQRFPLVAKAWGNVRGIAQTGGTYSVNANVCTVTLTSHGWVTGQRVRLTPTSGTMPTGFYTITSHTANTFTVAVVTANTSGNVNITLGLRSGSNVADITKAAAGDFTVTMANAMPDTTYCVVVTCSAITNGTTYCIAYVSVVSTTQFAIDIIGSGSTSTRGDPLTFTFAVFALN